MSAGSIIEGDRSPATIISGAAEAIRLAEDYLNRAVDATHGYDPQVVRQIRIDLASLDVFQTQLTEVGTMGDEVLSGEVAGKLKLQIPGLQAVSDDVKRIASDTKTPPGVGGYMEQTVTFIAQAVTLIGELP